MGVVTIFLISSPIAYADVVSPLKQAKFGFESDDIICKQGFVKAVQKSDNQILCLKLNTAEKLHKSNLITIYATINDFEEIQNLQKKESIGTIKILSVTEQKLKPKKFESNPDVEFFYVSFEICGKNKDIRTPEIIINSDSETKPVKIAERIFSNTCQANVAKIKAINSDSITIELLNKGGISEKIINLEERVNLIKSQLKEEKSELSSKLNQKQKFSDEGITKVVELRKELNQAKEDLNRLLFALNVMPKFKSKDIQISKSFTGVPVEKIVVNKLATMPALKQENTYDVVFEMCTSNQMVRIPMVEVISDLDSKSVKLADKISPNSCQVSGTKIKALNIDSIKLSSKDSKENSSKINELEKQLADLNKSLQKQKQNLRELNHLAPRPSNFNQQLEDIANSIIDLRKEILDKKSQIYFHLTNVYG